MKTKTDLYTKIMLTATVALLTAHLVKDINFVTKANANELDLSAMKIENTSDAEGTTFFIYDISKLEEPYSNWGRIEFKIKYDDMPTHIITNMKVPEHSYITIEKTY